ncbi:unnamed protein product [Amaranthus hypochondriacus]
MLKLDNSSDGTGQQKCCCINCGARQNFCSVGGTSSLAAEINELCNNVRLKRPTIYRVPEHLRNLNVNAYTPWHISIGPYHHKHPKYKIMDDIKLEYMNALFFRRFRNLISDINNNKSEEDIRKENYEGYVNLVSKLEPMARSCYAEEIKLSRDDFAKMLLIDGCFVVKFLCRKMKKLARFEVEAWINFEPTYKFINNTYYDWDSRDDFILKSTRTAFEVRRDLTLLENQLPYFVLKDLFEFTFGAKQRELDFEVITYCALRTSIPNIMNVLTKKEIEDRIEDPETSEHFVSFLKSCCGALYSRSNYEDEQRVINLISEDHPSSSDHYNQTMGGISRSGVESEFPCLCNMKTHEIRVPNASKLAKSGVLFEQRDCKAPLLEIKFDNEKGVLEMPVLIIWHHTETFFRNTMVYELYNHRSDYQNASVSDYMCFMDDLMDSKEDVAVLVESGIIQNWLESDQVVADLFNSITKHILADYSSYSETCKKMNEYRKKRNIRQLKAVVQQDYFNQPWAIVYFITGVIIQTAAAVIQAASSFKSNTKN